MDGYKNASGPTAALVEMNVEGWHGGNHCRGPAVLMTLWLASASRCIWLLKQLAGKELHLIQDIQKIFVCTLQIKVGPEANLMSDQPSEMGCFLTHMRLQLELYLPDSTDMEDLGLKESRPSTGGCHSYFTHFYFKETPTNCVNYCISEHSMSVALCRQCERNYRQQDKELLLILSSRIPQKSLNSQRLADAKGGLKLPGFTF